jgi:hypothetical protein
LRLGNQISLINVTDGVSIDRSYRNRYGDQDYQQKANWNRKQCDPKVLFLDMP